MKRIGIFALVLAVTSLLYCCPALAADTRTNGAYTYSIKGNGTVTITHYDWYQNDGDVYIPSMLDGYTVTEIGEEAFAGDDTTTRYSYIVTLPDTINTIRARAFFMAPISSINIPDGIKLIEDGAFTTRKTIQFNISSNHPYYAVISGALYEKKSKKLLCGVVEDFLSIPEGIVSIGDYACYSDPEVVSPRIGVSVPATVTSIGAYAFANLGIQCGLDSDYGFAGVQALGEGCFQNVTFFDAFVLPEGITEIPAHAFEDCGFFEAFTLPNSITTFGDCAFQKMKGYVPWESTFGTASASQSEYHMEETGEWLTEEDLDAYGLDSNNYETQPASKESILPSSLVSIGDFCFTGSEDLFKEGELTLPSGVKRIGEQAFVKCGLDHCILPEGVNDISSDAFDRDSVTLQVTADSYGELFAQESGYKYDYGESEDLSWLND